MVLHIIFWNANGVRGKTMEIRELLERTQPHALLINETHLKPRMRFGVPGYIVARKDRPDEIGPKGGTAILVRADIHHSRLPDPQTEEIEATSVEIFTDNHPVTLTSVYKRPGNRLRRADLQTLFSTSPTIAAGDWNASHTNWDQNSNRDGTRLVDYAADLQLEIEAPDEPTHYSSGFGTWSTLDLAVHEGLRGNVAMRVLPELSSDHWPVEMVVLDHTPSTQPKAPVRTTNWNIYRRLLEDRTVLNGPPESNVLLDAAVEELQCSMKDARDRASKLASSKKPYFLLPEYILRLLEEKKTALRTWKRSRDPRDKTILNSITKKVRIEMLQQSDRDWEHDIREAEEDPRKLWKLVRKVREHRTTPAPVIFSGRIVREPQDKVEHFAEHLATTFTNPERRSPPTDPQERGNAGDFINPAEVQRVLRELNPRTAPGEDGITNKMAKHLGRKATMALTYVMTGAIRQGHFPKPWKHSKVFLIKKPGKPACEPDSYRPINLLPTLGKVFERVVKHRISETVDLQLREDQFGFRKHRGTEDQLLRFWNFVRTKKNCYQNTLAVFLDLSKAFDTVKHELLLQRITGMRLPDWFARLTDSFLRDRTFAVSLNGETSSSRFMDNGVPQGSVLSPLLFNIYINSMPRFEHHERALTALFADDAAFAIRGHTPDICIRYMQPMLDRLAVWCEESGLRVNAAKTQVVWFSRKTKFQRRKTPLRLDGQTLHTATTAKYLGVRLSWNRKWSRHLSEKKKTGLKALHALTPLIGRRSTLSVKTKLRLYKSVIRPTMTYGCEVWPGADTKPLQIVQNKALRYITGAPWYARNRSIQKDLDFDSMDDHIQRLRNRGVERREENPLQIIRELILPV